jgi:glutamine cyclotransferase
VPQHLLLFFRRQGLTFANGKLFESTGLNKKSTIRQLDPVSGNVLVSVPLGDEYFGEGLAHVDGKLVQITWKQATAFVWNASDLTTIPPTIYSYETTRNNEGWGITYWEEKNELVVSDGSANLIFWDPNTLETLRTLSVIRQNSQPAVQMNELEFWRGRVLANVWYQDVLLVIHPETGVVEKEYDFHNLWPQSERQNYGADVFNGISITDDPDILLVTGKLWNRMYRIKLLP